MGVTTDGRRNNQSTQHRTTGGERMKKISKQRRWQLKMKAAGRCSICGKPCVEGSRSYCHKHLAMNRKASFEYQRKKNGIPADHLPG